MTRRGLDSSCGGRVGSSAGPAAAAAVGAAILRANAREGSLGVNEADPAAASTEKVRMLYHFMITVGENESVGMWIGRVRG
jgi:hypothetical protein